MDAPSPAFYPGSWLPYSHLVNTPTQPPTRDQPVPQGRPEMMMSHFSGLYPMPHLYSMPSAVPIPPPQPYSASGAAKPSDAASRLAAAALGRVVVPSFKKVQQPSKGPSDPSTHSDDQLLSSAHVLSLLAHGTAADSVSSRARAAGTSPVSSSNSSQSLSTKGDRSPGTGKNQNPAIGSSTAFRRIKREDESETQPESLGALHRKRTSPSGLSNSTDSTPTSSLTPAPLSPNKRVKKAEPSITTRSAAALKDAHEDARKARAAQKDVKVEAEDDEEEEEEEEPEDEELDEDAEEEAEEEDAEDGHSDADPADSEHTASSASQPPRHSSGSLAVGTSTGAASQTLTSPSSATGATGPARPAPSKRSYKCRVCSMMFLSHTCKTRHERTHTGERPFKCPHCDKRFRQKGTMVTHVRIHTGEKPYSCRFCGASFRHRSTINRHVSKCSRKDGDPAQLARRPPVMPNGGAHGQLPMGAVGMPPVPPNMMPFRMGPMPMFPQPMMGLPPMGMPPMFMPPMPPGMMHFPQHQ